MQNLPAAKYVAARTTQIKSQLKVLLRFIGPSLAVFPASGNAKPDLRPWRLADTGFPSVEAGLGG